MSEAILINKMGVQPKLEDIEAMEEDPPPLSEIKTPGYTPSTPVTTEEAMRYESLDTPTPMKSTELLTYTRHDPSKSYLSLLFLSSFFIFFYYFKFNTLNINSTIWRYWSRG